MKIVHYSYDSTKNPYCAGGGAYRSLSVHSILAAKNPEYTITFYSGNYKGAKAYNEGNSNFLFLGSAINYLIDRLIFSIVATIHSLFVNADIIVVEFSAYSPVLTPLIRRRKCVVQFHHFQGKQALKKYGLVGLLPLLTENMTLWFAKNIITPADSTAQRIKDKFGEDKRIRAGYNGFDQSLLKRNREDGKFILSLGRIDIFMKGLDILIPAFEKIAQDYPDYKLIIAGRGAEKDMTWCKKRIQESEVSQQISLKLDIAKETKMKLLAEATFVCIPSRFEGWCIVAIEAAASMKATLGTEIDGLRDSIKNNETGILVPSEDINALAQNMKLLINNVRLRTILSENGYTWSQNFTWEKVAQIQHELYLDILR